LRQVRGAGFVITSPIGCGADMQAIESNVSVRDRHPSSIAGNDLAAWCFVVIAGTCGGAEPYNAARSASLDAAIRVEHVFPRDGQPSPSFDDCMFASPLAIESRGESFVLVAAADRVAAVDPETGERAWEVAFASPSHQIANVVATPVVADSKLIV